MNLEVIDHKGLPESGVLSVRAGSTRRQATIDQLGGKPFKFPHKPQEVKHIKIDVLDHLASGRLEVGGKPRQEYILDLEPAIDGVSQTMSVTFSVKGRGEGAGGGHASDSAGNRSGNESMANFPTFAQLDLNSDGVITKEEFEKATTAVKGEWAVKREHAAKGYLEEHGLVSFMQFLMQSLMKDKPGDPYAFLQKQVAMRAAQQRLLASGTEDQDIDALLKKLDPEVSGAASIEQLAALEREALAAGERLKDDNDKLRSTALELKSEYDRLLQESMSYRDKAGGTTLNLPPITETTGNPKTSPAEGETPQVSAYKEILAVQEEVSVLAKENSSLVESLASMMQAIDAVRGEISSIDASIRT
jgi:hypothetical protein